jgi:hypothetical protein
MRGLLRLDCFVDAMELLLNALDLASRGFALLAIQIGRRHAGQTPLRAVHDRRHHFQIAQQFGGYGGGGGFHLLPLRFEKQLRRSQNALADRGRALAPRGIQLAGFAQTAVVLGEDLRHPLAILDTLACHRHQKLQGHLRQDLALAHLLLGRFGQNLHQRQPPRYPAHAAIELARQVIQPIAEAQLQFRQQPAHF